MSHEVTNGVLFNHTLEQLHSELENESGSVWFGNDSEGQLLVDVYQDSRTIYIVSTLAGVAAEDLEISIDDDILTIRGTRKETNDVTEKDYFYQECYWGGFSRSIILPVDIRADRATATLKSGVLTIKLPKATKKHYHSISVEEE